MKLDSRAQSDLRAHLPRLLSRARSLLNLPPSDEPRLAPRELRRAAGLVSELHQGLVGERTLARAATYDRAAHLGAYLLWWWPQSYVRVRAALELAPLPFAAPSSGKDAAPLRILDLGAGPGPAALAIADWLIARGHRVEALLVDESERALAEARALAAGRPHLSLRAEALDLSAPPARATLAARASGAFELISAAHLLSELPPGTLERARFLQELCDAHLAPRGALLVVEPALRETGRALLEVRDALLRVGDTDQQIRATQPGRLSALAPCLTQARCPALQHPRDWCTAEVSWSAPPHLLQLSRELGLHAEAPLSFAPMLLSRAVPAPPGNLWRVVGVPQEEKGKKRLFICAGRGRLAVARLDRDASAANHAFDEAARGDLIQLEGLAVKGDGLRLAREGAATLPGADALAARASAASDAPGDSARPDAGEGRGGEQ